MDLHCSIEGGREILDDEIRHGDVDFAGQLDEAGAEVELAGLPGEIEGVDGNAVAAQAGAGIESLEAKGLGFGGVDDLVDIDAHAHAELLELVDQGDVDAAVDVFEELGHLGDGGAADGNGAAEDGAVHGGGQFAGFGAASADDLGNVVAGDGFVAGIFALGREGDVDAGLAGGAGDLEAAAVAGFEQGDDDFFGGAGIGGAFKDDQLALVDVGRDGLDGAGDVAEVGFVVIVERGGDADDDGVHGLDLRVIGGGAEAGLLRFLDGFRQDADDVGAAGVESADLVLRDVEASDAKALVAEEQGEGQADIAHADDSDAGVASFQLLLQFSKRCRCGGCHGDDCKASGRLRRR